MKSLLLCILFLPTIVFAQHEDNQFNLSGTLNLYSPPMKMERTQLYISTTTFYKTKGFNHHSIGILFPVNHVFTGIKITRFGDAIYSKNQFSASAYVHSENFYTGGILTFQQEQFEGFENRNSLIFGVSSFYKSDHYQFKGNISLAPDSTQSSAITLGFGYEVHHFTPFIQCSFLNQIPFQSITFGLVYQSPSWGVKTQVNPNQKSLSVNSSFIWGNTFIGLGVTYSLEVQYASEIQGSYAW